MNRLAVLCGWKHLSILMGSEPILQPKRKSPYFRPHSWVNNISNVITHLICSQYRWWILSLLSMMYLPSIIFIYFFNINVFILIRGELLYNIVLVLPYIDMNPPRVYLCSPSWAPLPPPSPSHPSGSSPCTSPEHSVSCIEPGLAIHFTYDNIHVSMPLMFSYFPSMTVVF